MEVVSNSKHDFDGRTLLIGGNMVGLHLQNILAIYISGEVQVHPYPAAISSSNLSQNQQKFQPLSFLRSIGSIVFANSMPKAKLIS